MFTLHVDPLLSYGGPSTELLADILDYSPRITFSPPNHHQSDFTATYLMQLQAAKNRRTQCAWTMPSWQMILKKHL